MAATEIPQAIVLLNQKRDNLALAVPSTVRGQLTATRIVQTLGAELTRPGKQGDRLRSCDPMSVYRSALEGVGLGLDFGLKQAYLVPFYNKDASRYECSMMIGYKGVLVMMRRANVVRGIPVVNVVHQKDVFKHNVATGYVHHELELLDDPGPVIAAYTRMVPVDADAEPYLHIMPVRDFLVIQENARIKNGGTLSPAYQDYPDEMFRRSCLKRASKHVPMTRDLEEVLETKLDPEDAAVPELDLSMLGTGTAAPPPGKNVMDADEVEAELAKEKARDAPPAAAKEKAPAKEKPAGKMPQHEADATAFRAELDTGVGFKAPISWPAARERFKKAVGAERLADSRWNAGIKHGVDQGWWRGDDASYLWPAVKPSDEREPGDEDADDLPPEAGGVEELSGDALIDAITKEEGMLAAPDCRNAAAAAGDDSQLEDGSAEHVAWSRRYLVELRKRTGAL